MFDTFSVAVPGFDTVSASTDGDPTFTFPKASGEGATEIPGNTPVPVIATPVGLPAASCVIVSVPDLAPRDAGVNVTFTT